MSASQDHRFSDLAASYALGALDADELRDFEAHLQDCADCRLEVDEYRAVSGLLAYGVPSHEPPPALRASILAKAQDWRTSPAPSPKGPPGWVSVWRLAPASALLAVASLLLAVVATTGYLRERAAHFQTEAALAATLDELDERNAVLGAFLSEAVSAARLTSAGTDQSIRLFWNRDQNVVLVAAFNLPPAEAGRTYQLWGIPEGQSPVSLGTFNTGTGGEVTVLLTVPPGVDVQDSDLSAVTDEPAGGSPQPTTTPFLVGPWDHAQ